MAETGNIRLASVSSIDYENGMMRVVYPDRDGAVSAPFPFLSFNDEYKMPKVGQDVLVVCLSNGTSAGVVIGPYWNRTNRPADGRAGVYRKELGGAQGEAFIAYDEATKTVTIKADKIVLEGSSSVEASGSTIDLSGANISLKGGSAVSVSAPALSNSTYWALDDIGGL